MSELLLPSERRRLEALQQTQGKNGIQVPEEKDKAATGRKLAPNGKYPFLTQDECEGKPDYELESLNRIKKIMLYYDNVERYRGIVKQFPEQKLYRDKFNYEEDDTKTIKQPKRRNAGGKNKGGTFYN